MTLYLLTEGLSGTNFNPIERTDTSTCSGPIYVQGNVVIINFISKQLLSPVLNKICIN